MAAKLSGAGGGDKYVIEQNADINVTPFVDIMLVLLIIFMVSIPPPTASLKLDLPPPQDPHDAIPPKKPVYISVGADGSLNIGGFVDKATTRENLPADLTAALNARFPENSADPRKNQVLIRADADVEYEKFMDTLNILEQNGFLKIGLISESLQ
ncbi:MAG: biopolymer transporter ExbD [Proteobacteria bacterium]|nr:biopolymer transporter ExbD [Pseudomonadota bacterium]